MAKQTFTTGQVLTAAQMTSLQQTAMGGGAATAKTTSYVLVAADAGTTVAMDAAGSTTITVNTGLFSAGDSVFIQNRGAGTTTITAGTATVNTHGSLALSQWEGGQLYFTSASAAIFFDISQSTGMTNPMTTTGDTIYSSSGSTPARLGIGSTGNVLTVAGGVPTWAAPAATGKTYTLLNAGGTTLSGSSTTISGISSKDELFVMIYNGILNQGNVDAVLTLNGVTSSSYLQTNGIVTNGGSVSSQSTTSTGFIFGHNSSQYAGSNISAWATISGCSTTGYKIFNSGSSADLYGGGSNQFKTVGGVLTTTTVTSLTVSGPGGSNWTSGTIYVYGA
jgi:hypothetical protein